MNPQKNQPTHEPVVISPTVPSAQAPQPAAPVQTNYAQPQQVVQPQQQVAQPQAAPTAYTQQQQAPQPQVAPTAYAQPAAQPQATPTTYTQPQPQVAQAATPQFAQPVAQPRVFSDEHHDIHENTQIDNHQNHAYGNPASGSKLVVGAQHAEDGSVTWESSEFLHHKRSQSWYMGFIGITIMIACGLFLILGRDWWAATIVILMGATILAIIGKEPGLIRYTLSEDGISIGEKHYEYEQFKSFSVIDTGNVAFMTLDPLARFMPPISMYFSENEGEAVVGLISAYLPHVEKEADILDSVLTKFKF